jgi:nucleoside-diphosphate-sugar epimerase
MNALITGATGYIGFNVSQAFRRAGHSVIGLVLDGSRAAMLEKNEIMPLIGDLWQPETYRKAAMECDVLVHCAADYAHDWAGSDRLTIQTMISASQASPQPKTVIFTSGSWVYGNSNGKAVDETAPLSSIQVGSHRPAIEQMLLSADHTRGLVVRPANVFGKREGMLHQWIDDAYRGKDLVIAGSGYNHWPMVHADDLAMGYLLAAERSGNSEIFHFAGPTQPTVRELVSAIVRVTSFTGSVRYLPLDQALQSMGPNAEPIALDLKLDSSKAQRLLGWKARHVGFVPEAETYFASWKSWRISGEVVHATS